MDKLTRLDGDTVTVWTLNLTQEEINWLARDIAMKCPSPWYRIAFNMGLHMKEAADYIETFGHEMFVQKCTELEAIRYKLESIINYDGSLRV